MSLESDGSITHDYHGSIPLWRRLSYPTRDRLRSAGKYLALALLLLVILFPLFWMISTAFRPRAQAATWPTALLPPTWTLENFELLFNDSLFFTYYKNSIIVAIGVVFTTTLTATLGGYGLTRIDFRFKKTFARGILFGYMFPPILLSIPMFIFWRQVGILNTYIGLILAETGVALPFALWLMWKFFQTVPISLEESAQMSGASRFRAFWDVALPMAKPGMIAVGVFAFAVAWNEYTIPKILMIERSQWVLTIGVYSFTQGHQVFWGQLMAASALMLIPSFLFVMFLQKYILRGFRMGDVG